VKKEIKQISLIPFVIFIVFSLFFITGFYYYLNDFFNKSIKEIERKVLNIEKNHLKKDINDFKNTYYLVFNTIYSSTKANMEIFLKTLLKKYEINNLYISKDNYFVFGKVTDKKLKYNVLKNRFVLLNLNKNKFLVNFANKGKNVYLIGINKKFLDSLALCEIRKYLDRINKNTQSYIPIGRVTSFEPDKNGVFGYVFYMPPKLKEKEGMLLSIYKPDAKGNLFRKKYFNCVIKHKNCFIRYYFKNPKTEKIEEKISYFTLLDNKFLVAKGIYSSQLKNKIKKEILKLQEKLKRIFYTILFLYFILFIVTIILLNYLISKNKKVLIYEYKKLLRDLKYNYFYDKLTNLPNRNKLIEDLIKYKSLILLDIDDFSDINDVYGYFIGNKLLKKVANELKKKYNHIYRIGSDEFAIGLSEKIDEKELSIIANEEYEYNLIKISFTVSGSNKKGELLKTAESALKVAKKSNKNCVIFNNDIETAHKRRIKTIQKLKKVLEEEKIIPFYQCLVGEKEKYEALMRIEMDKKIITPFVFLNLLKEAKLYHKFSQIMIKKVFNDISNGKIKNVSINLSFIDIIDDETRELIFNLINNCKKNYQITFEILESESIENFEVVEKFIKNVKKEGIKIAIDDFGSGYSNFIRVLELNPDFIKIDGSLIKNIHNKKYYEIVKLIVEFANKFNIKTVAEFVENEEIYSILKNLGIDYYQGYFFCKPETLEKIRK